MTTTADHTLQCAFGGGFRASTEADRATVHVQALSGTTPSGVNLILDGVSATVPDMTQWEAGAFTYTTTGAPLTRGSRYRAFFSIYLGGVIVESSTQDFTAASELVSAAAPTPPHAYTCLSLRDVVRRTLGLATSDATSGPQEPGGSNSLDIVNDELEAIWRAHRWQWQMGDRVYGALIPNQSKYRLPSDFMELKNLVKPNNIAHRFVRQTWEKIRELRERAVSAPPLVNYYAVVSDPPSSLSGLTRYALEMWPIPLTYEQSGYVLDWYREYPKISADADIAPFPIGFHSAVKQCVRAAAMESENDPKAGDERAKAEGMLARAAQHDGRHTEMNLGSMIERRNSIDPWDPEASHDAFTEIDA